MSATQANKKLKVILVKYDGSARIVSATHSDSGIVADNWYSNLDGCHILKNDGSVDEKVVVSWKPYSGFKTGIETEVETEKQIQPKKKIYNNKISLISIGGLMSEIARWIF